MKKKALILVDHGSVVKEANDILAEIANMIKQTSREFYIVLFAHMELAEPKISQAFDTCVAKGAKEIIVHPYFLAPGRHSTQDIPNMVKDAAKKYPQVSYHITEPLGIHHKIIDVILERAMNIGNK
jgi:sirohydrochlorin ferrochelatase